jgi:hypothetical protein
VKKYKLTRIVEAEQIVDVRINNDDTTLFLADDSTVSVDRFFLAEHQPSYGDIYCQEVDTRKAFIIRENDFEVLVNNNS